MKKVKLEIEFPEWVLAILYVLGCGVFGAVLGAIVGLLLDF